MLIIGCHLSTAKGFLAMGKEAARIGANTFQFFTRNPRGSRAKALNQTDVAAFVSFAREHAIGPILGHASYTLNPAAEDAHQRDYAKEIMADDLERLENFPGSLYNFHPGRHKEADGPRAAGLVADTLNSVLREDMNTTVLLETMSGQGGELGGTFENLKAIMDATTLSHKLGVCLDTCHIFAAGYDIVNDLDMVIRYFDKIVGLGRLRAIHCNDSQYPLGSRKDRHANIGDGHIGRQGFAGIINHPALRGLPFYLETHNDPDGYGKEIALLRQLYREEH